MKGLAKFDNEFQVILEHCYLILLLTSFSTYIHKCLRKESIFLKVIKVVY